MKIKLIYLLIFCTFNACYTKVKVEKPIHLISEDKMVAILLDITLLNAAKSIDRKKVLQNGYNLSSYVYKKHQIDSAQFAASNTYYSYNIKQYNSIYKKVDDSLNAIKDSLLEKTKGGVKDTPKNIGKAQLLERATNSNEISKKNRTPSALQQEAKPKQSLKKTKEKKN